MEILFANGEGPGRKGRRPFRAKRSIEPVVCFRFQYSVLYIQIVNWIFFYGKRRGDGKKKTHTIVGVIHSSIDQCVPSVMISRPRGIHTRWVGLRFIDYWLDILLSLFIIIIILDETNIETFDNLLISFQLINSRVLVCFPKIGTKTFHSSTTVIPLPY